MILMTSCIVGFCFFFNETATTEIYTYLHTLSLHDALPISAGRRGVRPGRSAPGAVPRPAARPPSAARADPAPCARGSPRTDRGSHVRRHGRAAAGNDPES